MCVCVCVCVTHLMHKHLLAAIVGREKAPTLGHIEPFAFAHAHTAAFLSRIHCTNEKEID